MSPRTTRQKKSKSTWRHCKHESTLDFIPALVFLSLLIVVGIIGNTLVLVVYTTKMTRTPLRVFIIHLAFFDLLAEILVIPGEIYDMFHVWNFKFPTVCKIRRSLSATFIISSALILVAISTTRYKVVCGSLGNHLTLAQIKLLSIANVMVSSLIATPYAIIQGSQTVKTPDPLITGSFCQVDDSYTKTIWPTVNSFAWRDSSSDNSESVTKSSSIVARLTSPCQLEVNVSVSLSSKLENIEEKSEPQTSQILSSHSSLKASNDHQVNKSIEPEINCNTKVGYVQDTLFKTNKFWFNQTGVSKESITKVMDTPCAHQTATKVPRMNCSSISSQAVISRRRVLSRTTCMMLSVTVLFFVTFLPFLIISSVQAASPDSVDALKGASLAVYQLLLRSYLVNCAVNPVVYSFCDRKFRRESFRLLSFRRRF
ncbi:melatonin receptor type 1B-B [Biomphalaria pfeifferi]|uniref:Melatonin receptor type 1B-B n=1 Tax=Biomphalaria pfeifferi TaxID=112525 RepID=A0AAD8EYX9_BIOPF|nr:melatonin receptor type 1B-B [Biomphalaria pfeifferi]